MKDTDTPEQEILPTSIYHPKDILVDILREFGVVGIITYVGGAIMLYHFPNQNDFNKQVLLAASGLILLALATFISYIRLKALQEREKLVIEMGQNSCNRLAEQLGKGLSKEQTDGISQKIRQIHRDVHAVIFNHKIEFKRSLQLDTLVR